MIYCIKVRVLLHLICEKCVHDLISSFPFWPQECCASFFGQINCLFLVSQMFGAQFFLFLFAVALCCLVSDAGAVLVLNISVCTICECSFTVCGG